MPDLALTPDYILLLATKVRGVQGRDVEVIPDDASNPTDDNETTALDEGEDDLSREEVIEEISGLNERQQSELVALLWTGRGDAEPEDWEATVSMARERATSPTETYLLAQPLLAEHWLEGLERLGLYEAVDPVAAPTSR